MYLSISSPDIQLFEGIVEWVTLPGSQGIFQVLPNHAPLVSTLEEGKIFYRVEDQEHMLDSGEGLVEINNNKVTVLLNQTPTKVLK